MVCAVLFFACRLFAGSPPPHGWLVSSVVLCGASCRVVLRSLVCFVFCRVLCGVLVSGWVLAPCCSAVLCCFCRALLSCAAAFSAGFFCVVSCLSVALRPVTVLCLCGAVLVCLPRCSLCGVLLPLRRWPVFCVGACCVSVLAFWPGCPLLSPGGSLWLLVSCFGGVLWCVPGCCAAPCCCALCRLALCCCALRCLALSLVVSCSEALSVVLGSWAFGCRFLPCLPALCVFCCGVLLRGVVRRCASCRVHPGVSCCALPVLPALCGVAVRPCSPLVPCFPVLCPVVLCCRVVLWSPVLLPCLVCFLCLFGFSYLKNRCRIC